jgi:hypothetical protein
MKKALLGCTVVSLAGTEFVRDNGNQKAVKVGLEEGYSFNLNISSPWCKKIAEGMEIDISYQSVKETVVPSQSGDTTFTFRNVAGVKILDIRKGDTTFLDKFEDVTDPGNISFRAVGGNKGADTANPPKL